MKSTIYRICDKELAEKDDVGLVYFKKRQFNKDWEKRMEEIVGVSHLSYSEWFFEKYYKKANELKYLSIDETLKLLMF